MRARRTLHSPTVSFGELRLNSKKIIRGALVGSDRSIDILIALRRSDGKTAQEIASQISLPTGRVRLHLARLAAVGFIVYKVQDGQMRATMNAGFQFATELLHVLQRVVENADHGVHER